jgi:hypothetical protein
MLNFGDMGSTERPIHLWVNFEEREDCGGIAL